MRKKWSVENKHINGSRGSCGQHKAAARSVVVGVPGVVFGAGGAPAHHSSPMGVQSTGWQTLRCSGVVSCILEAVLLGAAVVVVPVGRPCVWWWRRSVWRC